MSCYNITRSAEQILDSYEDAAPSFSVHLYPDHWTLNNGSKFLYNNPIASILDDVRAHRIPVDYLELFDSARVPFYDGCMIVELLDYRPKKVKDPPLEKPERSRVTLHPNDETLWANLCLMNQRSGNKFTDTEVLELEAQILLQTSPPLCLDPDPHLTRIANHTLRVSTPSIPISLKRKAAAITPEEDESDKTRRAKIMQFMNQRQNRSHAPSYRILDTIRRVKEVRMAVGLETQPYLKAQLAQVAAQSQAQTEAQAQADSQGQNQAQGQIPAPAPTPQPQAAQLQPIPVSAAPAPASTPAPQPVADQKPKLTKKNADVTQAFPMTPEVSRSSATPVSHPAVDQLQSQPRHATSPSPRVSAPSPFSSVQSPAQRFTQSPRPPSSQAPHSSPLAAGSQLPPTIQRPPTVHQFLPIASSQISQHKAATPQVTYPSQSTPSPAQAGQQAGAAQLAPGQHLIQQHAQAQAQAPGQIYQLQQMQLQQARLIQAQQVQAQAQAQQAQAQAQQAQAQAHAQAQAQAQQAQAHAHAQAQQAHAHAHAQAQAQAQAQQAQAQAQAQQAQAQAHHAQAHQAHHAQVQVQAQAHHAQAHQAHHGQVQAQAQAQTQPQTHVQAERMTPQNSQSRSPLPGHPTARNSPMLQNQARGSPMLQNQARGSPMPNSNPLPPQPTQAAQHMGMPQQQYNFAPMQYRPAGQDQQQQHQMIMPQYPMYPYMSYAVPAGRSYQWSGVGRGMPNQAQVNGQAAVGMQQQMQIQMMQMQMAGVKPTQGTGR